MLRRLYVQRQNERKKKNPVRNVINQRTYIINIVNFVIIVT